MCGDPKKVSLYGEGTVFPCKAVLRRTKSASRVFLNYQDCPLFPLAGLSRFHALYRIDAMNENLGLKIELARLHLQGGEPVSKGCIAKLIAYTGWALYQKYLIPDQSQRQNSRNIA